MFHVEPSHGHPDPAFERPSLGRDPALLSHGLCNKINQLRHYRVRAASDPTMGASLEATMASVKRSMDVAKSVESQALAVIPAVLRDGVVDWSAKGRGLRLAIPSSGRRKRLIDWLRSGGEATISRATGGKILTVSVVHRAPPK